MDFYKDELLDHYRFARNRGTLLQPDFSSGQYNPSCGDQVSMQARIANGYLVAIAFQGSGCVISQACASMVTELVKDKAVSYLESLTSKDIQELLGIQLGPTRLKCALLSLYALQEGLREYSKKS